jgi:hypothetical protein
MLDYPIVPPITVKDTPKPRRLATINQARAFIEEGMRAGRPPPWREALDRLDGVKTEDEAIEAVGALRELLALEDLLVGETAGWVDTDRERG